MAPPASSLTILGDWSAIASVFWPDGTTDWPVCASRAALGQVCEGYDNMELLCTIDELDELMATACREDGLRDMLFASLRAWVKRIEPLESLAARD